MSRGLKIQQKFSQVLQELKPGMLMDPVGRKQAEISRQLQLRKRQATESKSKYNAEEEK